MCADRVSSRCSTSTRLLVAAAIAAAGHACRADAGDVEIVDVSLSPAAVRDGQVLQVGYDLSGPAGLPAVLDCTLKTSTGQILSDPDGQLQVQLDPSGSWFSRYFLLNVPPSIFSEQCDVTWQVLYGAGGAVSTTAPGLVTILTPKPVRIPILQYHGISQTPWPNTCWVTVDMLRAQMEALKAYGYTSVTLQDVMDFRAGIAATPPKPVVITFDDGTQDMLSKVLPVMADPAIDFKATCFVITAKADSPPDGWTYLTWDQMRALHASGRIDIQSHTVHHWNLAALSADDLRNELVVSRQRIQSELGKQVRYLCYPYGYFSSQVEMAAWEAGYFAATSTWDEIEQSCQYKYRLRRYYMDSCTTMDYDPAQPSNCFLAGLHDPDIPIPLISIDSITCLDPLTDQPMQAAQFTPGGCVKIRARASNAGPTASVIASLALSSGPDTGTGTFYDSHQATPPQDVAATFAAGQQAFEWTCQVPSSIPAGPLLAAVRFHDAKYVMVFKSSGWQDPFVPPPAAYYVDPVNGSDGWNGGAAAWDGVQGPKATIQAAIDRPVATDTAPVILAAGTYTGPGNRDIRFGGRSITVRSTDPGDPGVVASTVIDCNAGDGLDHRAFTFDNGETGQSAIEGLTIIHGTGGNGGGIYCIDSSPTLRNCVISNCSATDGGGLYCRNASPVLTGCTITDNSAVTGGGIYCVDSSPTLRNCVISNCSATDGSGVYCQSAGLVLTGCTIADNSATTSGGGISCVGGNPLIANCILCGNSTSGGYGAAGGGISVQSSAIVVVRDCQITGNSSIAGGGVSCGWGSSVAIMNSTLADNLVNPPGAGGAVSFDDDANGQILNCILWNSGGSGAGSPVYSSPRATVSVSHSDIRGGFAGDGNLDLDPLLTGDYLLQAGSPCINGGDPGYVPLPDEKDITGSRRIRDGRIDIGSYEWKLIREVNGDGHVDVGDLLILAGSFGLCDGGSGYDARCDLNGDQCVDVSDLLVLAEGWGT